jgi:hypothetical protein
MGRYINTVLGQRWTDEPVPEPSHLQYPSRTLQALGRLEAKIDVVLVERGVGVTAPAFTQADIEEVGRLLVEGRMIRLPVHARLTVRTSVEEVKSKIFGNSQLITHEADQIHTKLLRPLTVLESLEAGLIRRIERGWVWSEVVYERLASGACNG